VLIQSDRWIFKTTDVISMQKYSVKSPVVECYRLVAGQESRFDPKPSSRLKSELA